MDRRTLFIGGALLFQALFPLHYYLGSSDPYDERFAWRMFSETRLLSCQVSYQVDGQELNLKREFHSAWITLLKRGRPSVVDAVSERVCITHGHQDPRLLYRCRELDGDTPVYSKLSEPLCD
ncbi:MAG: hypothetical protein VX899_20825 [Myxococcota bacterium]|nr:hypothetical protein [Myxococcota bacterium]